MTSPDDKVAVIDKVTATVAQIRKALLAAASVATAIVALDGVPEDLKAWAVKALAVLAAGGITWRVPNDG